MSALARLKGLFFVSALAVIGRGLLFAPCEAAVIRTAQRAVPVLPLYGVQWNPSSKKAFISELDLKLDGILSMPALPDLDIPAPQDAALEHLRTSVVRMRPVKVSAGRSLAQAALLNALGRPSRSLPALARRLRDGGDAATAEKLEAAGELVEGLSRSQRRKFDETLSGLRRRFTFGSADLREAAEQVETALGRLFDGDELLHATLQAPAVVDVPPALKPVMRKSVLHPADSPNAVVQGALDRLGLVFVPTPVKGVYRFKVDEASFYRLLGRLSGSVDSLPGDRRAIEREPSPSATVRLQVDQSDIARYGEDLPQYMLFKAAQAFALQNLRKAGVKDPLSVAARGELGKGDLDLFPTHGFPELHRFAETVSGRLSRLVDFPPEAVELANAEPARVERLLKALDRKPEVKRAVLGAAESILRGRLKDSLGGREVRFDLEAEQKFDLYDDVLRILHLRGFLGGELVYPLPGPDFMPARWSKVFGINWTDYRMLFKKMVRSVRREQYADRLAERGRVEMTGIGSVFRGDQIGPILRRRPRLGPRTLLLKYVHGYDQDFVIDDAKKGISHGIISKGMLYYRDWLKTVAELSLRKGDLVVLLDKDARARRYFDRSKNFQRVEFELPVLEKVDDGEAVIHIDNQSLLFPDSVRVYRKVR